MGRRMLRAGLTGDAETDDQQHRDGPEPRRDRGPRESRKPPGGGQFGRRAGDVCPYRECFPRAVLG